MPTALIIRHAQGSFGAANYDALSPLGVEQSRALADELALRGANPVRMLSGSLARQRDTLAALGGPSAEVDPRWNEFDADQILEALSGSEMRLGSPGADAAAFQDLLDAALLRWIAGPTPPQIESWNAFSLRVGAAFDELMDGLGPGQSAVVCTSGGVVAALCSRLLGLRGSGFLTFNRVMVNTGISKFVRGARGDHLVSVNEHGHLGRPDGPALTYR